MRDRSSAASGSGFCRGSSHDASSRRTLPCGYPLDDDRDAVRFPGPTRLAVLAAVAAAVLLAATSASAKKSVQLSWMGHEWTVTQGGMAGVAPGRSSNVRIDANGHLHLAITRTGKRVTAAELFSNDEMGFGTYQWEVEGPLDRMDPYAVLGLFPYGPEHGIGRDGENEIDVEFSKWGNSLCGGECNADFTIYPATGNRATGPTEEDYALDLLGGDLLTARVEWRSTGITETVMSGLEPPGTTSNVLETWSYEPSDYLTRIPQQALPVGMNLWSFKRKVATSQAVTILSFGYAPF